MQDEANVPLHIPAIAIELFGIDAQVNLGNLNRIKLKAQWFTETLITHLWNAYWKTIDHDLTKIETAKGDWTLHCPT